MLQLWLARHGREGDVHGAGTAPPGSTMLMAELDLRSFAFMLQSARACQMQLGGQFDLALQERCCRFIRSML